MVPVLSLWLPILLAAVLVFVVSSIIHTVLGYHNNDFDALPNEEGVMGALRGFNLPAGDYAFPNTRDRKERGTDEFKQKMAKGPAGFLTLWPPGPPAMGASLVQWFLYTILVGIFAAYVAGRAVGPGAEYLSVFRFVGVTAFAAYGLALLQNSIWYRRSWSNTLKSVFDGFIYALLTAGVFGWLWPG